MTELKKLVHETFGLDLEGRALELFVIQWVKDMQEAGNKMISCGARAGLPSPVMAISFDSPMSYLQGLPGRMKDWSVIDKAVKPSAWDYFPKGEFLGGGA